MFCSNCGAQIPDTYKYCPKCGATVILNMQPGTPAPPPQVEGPTAWVTAGSRPLSSLGERLDGWADLIEGVAERAPEVIQAFQERVSVRQMPKVQHESSILTTGGLIGKRRAHQLVHTRTGATVAVYIGQFGKDLYVAWDLFIRPIVYMAVLLGILGAAALVAAFRQEVWTGRTTFNFSYWIGWTIILSMLFAVLVAIAGLVLKRRALAFFIKELDAFDAHDITAMTLAVHKSLLQALDAVGIDIHLLRVKERFLGGRRDRLI